MTNQNNKMTNLNSNLNKTAEVLSVNQDEAEKALHRTQELTSMVDELSEKNDNQAERLDDLLDSLDDIDLDDLNLDDLEDYDEEIPVLNEKVDLEPLTYMQTSHDFDSLIEQSEEYAEKCNLDLSNPYLSGLSEVEINQLSTRLSEKYEQTRLDKWDYAFAGVVGIIGGLMDAFLVGSVTDGNNPKTVDEQGRLSKGVDNVYQTFVKKYASFESGKKMDSPSQAIRWLEKHHKVSYDASNNGKVIEGVVKNMNPANHHLLSMAHDPGPLGLISGILDQMDGKSTFLSGGQLVRVVTDSAESKAVTSQTGPTKVIAAAQNWFGHICSDVSGASGSKGRGAGLPAPFYELTQKLNFGSVNIKGDNKSFAEVFEWLYKQGLDCRAFTAQAIPVLIMETLVRLYWVYKNHFYYGKTWKESIPIANKMDLQKLILTATATFETVDIADSIIQNGANVQALLRINFVGIVDMSFRSFQVLRSTVSKGKHIDKLDSDLQVEWTRVYQTI
ncbi:hypothetical protein [Lactiplantibacillus xiangfangensis]|nr:hypothetical protein [Lactiplantibacillus xiangfangensis]